MTFSSFTRLLGAVPTMALATVAGISVASANLISNGDFSSYTPYSGAGGFELDSPSGTANSLTGWTSAGYNFLFLPGTNAAGGSYSPQYNNNLALWSAANGGISNSWNGQGPTVSGYANGPNFVAMDGAYQTGALSQTINVTKGTNYAVSFYWAAGQQKGYTGPTTEGLTVSLGNQSMSTITVNTPSQGFVAWMFQTMTFTAQSTGSSTLSFLASGTPPGTPPFTLLAMVNMVDIPEPTSLLLLGTGLMCGMSAFRRRKRG